MITIDLLRKIVEVVVVRPDITTSASHVDLVLGCIFESNTSGIVTTLDWDSFDDFKPQIFWLVYEVANIMLIGELIEATVLVPNFRAIW